MTSANLFQFGSACFIHQAGQNKQRSHSTCSKMIIDLTAIQRNFLVDKLNVESGREFRISERGIWRCFRDLSNDTASNTPADESRTHLRRVVPNMYHILYIIF